MVLRKHKSQGQCRTAGSRECETVAVVYLFENMGHNNWFCYKIIKSIVKFCFTNNETNFNESLSLQ